MRRLLITVALVTAACGSTVPSADAPSGEASSSAIEDASFGGTPVESTTAGPAPSSRPGSAVAPRPDATAPRPAAASPSRKVTSPIKLGVLYAVNDGAEQAGINNGNTFTAGQVARAFVERHNASGGIGGRRIEPVYAELHSASSDYEAQLESICATFTEDNKVAAVLSNIGYYSASLLACLGKASVPLIGGDWTAPDNVDAGRFPLFVTPITLVGDARVAAMVTHLKASGFLQPSHRIGVVIEDCPIDQRIYRNSLSPAIHRAGLTVATTYSARCFLSLQDYGGQASDMQGAVLQFNSNRVDRVIFVSQGAEANMMNLFSQGAQAQQYFPGYALSSIAAARVLALNAPPTQLANARGVGWLPSVDTENRNQEPASATAIRCLDRMKQAGLVPATAVDFALVYGACDVFTLYDAALRATSGDSATGTVMRAIDTIGASYVSASTVGGRVVVRSGRIGAASGRIFAFVPSKGFEYISDAFAL